MVVKLWITIALLVLNGMIGTTNTIQETKPSEIITPGSPTDASISQSRPAIPTDFAPSVLAGSSWSGPQFTGTTTLNSNYCYMHDNLQPTLTLKGQSCISTQICNFDVSNGKFAWYSEATQSVSSGSSSSIQGKLSVGQCLDIDSIKVSTNGYGGLMGGRSCTADSDCYNQSCGGTGGGNSNGQAGYNHADGDANLFGNKQTYWPFRSTCNSLLGKMEICSDDYQCATQFFCWYASSSEKASGITRCIEKYSASDGQTFGWSTAPTGSIYTNNEYNGLFCMSGLAVNSATNEATCKGVISIKYNGATLSSPYPCTPTDTSIKGQLVYGTGATEYYEVGGKGSLSGTTGYCGSIIGTNEYKKFTAAMIKVNEGSSCHTLDRNDLRAQSESGGIGTSTDLWRYTIEKRFNVTYWPWIQNTDVLNGVNAVFDDSYTNLSKNSSMNLSYVASVLLGLILIII